MFLFFISSSSIVWRGEFHLSLSPLPMTWSGTDFTIIYEWHQLWCVNDRRRTKMEYLCTSFLSSIQWILSWPRRATRNNAVWCTPTHDAMYARRTKHNRTRPDEVCQGKNCMQLLFVVCAFGVWPRVLAVCWAGNSELIHLCVLWWGVEIGSSCRRRLCCARTRSAVPHMATARIWLPPAIQRHISRQFIYRRWKQRKRERERESDGKQDDP